MAETAKRPQREIAQATPRVLTPTRKVRRKTKGGISIADLIVNRGGVAKFARDLSQISGKQVTWGRVNNWKDRNSVSKSMVLYVHQLTGTPLKDLLC
jgi:hypothetical protein